MRIVGGTFKGQQIIVPQTGLRPTLDRVREAVTSSIMAYFASDLRSCRILDAFAGSGALGLEMLSRGAYSSVFIDDDKRACVCIQKNIKRLSEDKNTLKTIVLQGDALRLVDLGLDSVDLDYRPFSLVFLDPPYKKDPKLSEALLTKLANKQLLAQGALIVHEREKARPGVSEAIARESGFDILRERSYAHTLVTYFTYCGALN